MITQSKAESLNRDTLVLEGIINGDWPLTASNSIALTGSINVPSAKTKSLSVNGTAEIGTIEADSATFEGSITTQVLTALNTNMFAEVNARKVAGETLRGEGTLVSDSVEVRKSLSFRGFLNVGGIVTQDFQLDGSITSKRIDCDTVKLLLSRDGQSEIGAVKTESISVTGRGKRGHLTVESIEASECALENTTAQRVVADKVTIGPGCTIEHLSCRGVPNISPKSKVNHVEKRN